MRIGIDGRELNHERRGIGRYVFELCRELDRCLPEAEFFVYNRVPVVLPVASDRWILRTDPSTLGKRLSPLLWLKLRGGLLCRQDELDVFWGTSGFLPRLPRSVRTVVTVYDLCYVLTPETFNPVHLLGVRLFFARDVRKADAVLAISQGTSNRLHEHLGLLANAIVYPAVREVFMPQPAETIHGCRARYHLPDSYLLTVATWEPRKNLERLARAFIDLKERGLLPERKLVLVGKRGWRSKRLTVLLDREARQHMVSLGYVPDEHLPALYAGAEVFVFPSVYEGFGLPVLEARACGARVVASDIPELREAGGSDAIYVEPTTEGIREGILTALTRKPRPPMRSALPTWERGARTLATILLGAPAAQRA
jgi:glycosyltransferase involved in cell wall biosynthesis